MEHTPRSIGSLVALLTGFWAVHTAVIATGGQSFPAVGHFTPLTAEAAQTDAAIQTFSCDVGFRDGLCREKYDRKQNSLPHCHIGDGTSSCYNNPLSPSTLVHCNTQSKRGGLITLEHTEMGVNHTVTHRVREGG
ncbi:hypothetical protein JZ751_018634 [Albula glossodonta]|uniref:Uncharacterized protein n=1 Tax=Albula glossodonta TaxID=121402 RepID=A0A8T2MU22_9TELE|nr:hypothetical protein JZ751_018634 [Albula glossodonta]